MTHQTVYTAISILLAACLIWVYFVLVRVAKAPTRGFRWRLAVLLAVLGLPAWADLLPVGWLSAGLVQGLTFAKICVLLLVFLFCLTTGFAYLGFQLARLVRWLRRRPAAGAPSAATAALTTAPVLATATVSVSATTPPIPAPARALLPSALPASPAPAVAVAASAPAAASATTTESNPSAMPFPATAELAHEPDIELSRRRWLRNACYGFAGMTALTSVGAVWTESMGLQVRKVTLHCPKLPAVFRGYRVLQLTDIHSGPFMGLDAMRVVRAAAESLHSDLVVFTGDQVDTHWSQLPAFLEAFNGLKGKDGVYATLGNHDYIAGAQHVREGLEANGFPMLINRNVRIERGGQSIVLAGLDDLWHGVPDLNQALAGGTPDDFRLLLMHNPNSFLDATAAGADVMLAGHTHGGQINMIADCLSPARLFSPYVQGRFEHGAGQMFVNVGVGFVGVPVRIGVPAEIVEFTLV